jgi:hypothetical protein
MYSYSGIHIKMYLEKNLNLNIKLMEVLIEGNLTLNY